MFYVCLIDKTINRSSIWLGVAGKQTIIWTNISDHVYFMEPEDRLDVGQ